MGFYIVETCLRTVWTAFHPFSKCVQVRSKSTSDLDASWSASDQPGRISLQLRLDLATWTHFDLDALFFGVLTWTRVQGVQVATWTQNITVLNTMYCIVFGRSPGTLISIKKVPWA